MRKSTNCQRDATLTLVPLLQEKTAVNVTKLTSIFGHFRGLRDILGHLWPETRKNQVVAIRHLMHISDIGALRNDEFCKYP